MKKLFFLLFTVFSLDLEAQPLVVTGDATLIADFNSTGASPNVKGQYLEEYQTLISYIEGTKTVKCMVRVANTVNVVGVWEMNDLNDIVIKVYEVANPEGRNDLLLVSFMDEKALSLSLFRLQGEDLVDLGYNYLEQENAGSTITLTISKGKVQVDYDEGAEHPVYGILNGEFRELDF